MITTDQKTNQDGDNKEKKLSVDEVRFILNENGGSQTEEESLVDPGDKLTSDHGEHQGLNANNNAFRIAFVLLLTTLAGFAVVLTASLYSGIGKGTKVVENQGEVDAEIAEDSVNKDDERKAELAWAQQEADLAPEPQPQLVKGPETETETVQPTPQSRPTTTRPAPQPTPETEIDPLEQWAMLASLGVTAGNNEMGQLEKPPVTSSVNTQPQPQPQPSKVTSRPAIQDTIPTRTATNPSPRPLQDESQLVASSDIASVSIGKFKSEVKPEPEPLSVNSQEVKDFLTGTGTQAEQLARLSSAGVASANYPKGDHVVDASNKIENSSQQIPFGTTAKGELSSTIIWSEGISSGASRGKIVLQEPLLSEDGTVALDTGSILIVQVSSIQNSGLSELEVIAVSYTDSSGMLKQEPIPPQAIAIRGNDNSSLIAERANNNGGSNFGQDVLMGALGAGERGFEVLNERDVDYVSNSFPDLDFGDDELEEDHGSDYSSSSFRSRRGQNASLVTGAAEGAFGTTKERLEERSKQMASERANETPIYQLREGMKVSIFVNSFLEINR